MPANRVPNIPTIGHDPNLDPGARLLAPLFLIPRVGFVIKKDTGQNTARPSLLLPPVKRLTRGLGQMSYFPPLRPAPMWIRISARPRRITHLRPTPMKARIYAHPLRITLLPAITWIRFVIIK